MLISIFSWFYHTIFKVLTTQIYIQNAAECTILRPSEKKILGGQPPDPLLVSRGLICMHGQTEKHINIDLKNITGRRPIYCQVPIIANLHITRERRRIYRPFFADDNNKWWQSRQQNPTIVSWLIQKKSGKTPLETIPLYISFTGRSRNRSGDASRYY